MCDYGIMGETIVGSMWGEAGAHHSTQRINSINFPIQNHLLTGHIRYRCQIIHWICQALPVGRAQGSVAQSSAHTRHSPAAMPMQPRCRLRLRQSPVAKVSQSQI